MRPAQRAHLHLWPSLIFGLVISPGFRAAPSSALPSSALRVASGDTPLNLVETRDAFLISTNSGYGPQYLQAYDEEKRQVSDRLELRSLWYGLDFQPAQQLLLASSGRQSVFAIPFTQGKFGKPREIVLNSCDLTAGLAIQNRTTAVVACNQKHQLLRFDVQTGTVLARATVGEYPYAVKALPGDRLATSNWGQASISILDGRNLKILQTIRVGSHPSDMLVLPQRSQLVVACADSDLISIIDLNSLREIHRANIHIPGSPLGGAQPNALAFDSANRRLFVALAALNAVAVFELSRKRDEDLIFQGLIPVGSYPTALLHSPQGQLFIADGRNPLAGPSSPTRELYKNSAAVREYKSDSGSPLTYLGYLVGGGIEVIADSDLDALRPRMLTLAQQVYGTTQDNLSSQDHDLMNYFSAKSNPASPVRHVIYIIKENRTYDQVFGDMKQGDGDPDLVLFGEAVTPNQHALARQFVLFDNFYVDGDVSYDGHLWSTTGSATDYANKLWPSEYSGHIQFDLWGSDYNGDDTHDHPIAAPVSGFIWDLAQRAGLTYRDYGELCDNDDKDNPGKRKAFLRGLKGHYDPYYGAEIGKDTDQKRVDEWQREFREFEQKGDLPQLSIVYLPNDHTEGAKPGARTPRAMVADNDLAVGRLVDIASHSRFWPHLAIFVLEDDAQDGPDHVDAHRSPVLVISPYVRHGTVEHAHFSTVAVLKTIEQLLGLGSLTYFDDRAPSFLADFQIQPVLDSYTSLIPQVNLDEMNPPDGPGARESATWDFSHPDCAPAQELNRIIWKSVKGRDSEPPAPVFNVQFAARMGLGYQDGD